VRLNIVGQPEKLEKVGAQKLVNYIDEIMQRYNIDSVDSHAYLNRAALVGCKNKDLSKNYAKQLYTRAYLRRASVTGRIGDIQVNTDGSKTDSNRHDCLLNLYCSVALFHQCNLLNFEHQLFPIFLAIGDDKVTQESVQSLYEKHPDNSVIVTLDEQGRLVFPEGKVFIPDASVRLPIVLEPSVLTCISPILPVTLAPLKYSRV
jgi:hypothetical protein